MAEPEVEISSLTNMYAKLSTEQQFEQLYTQLMPNMSVADTKHDFATNNDLLLSAQFKGAYCRGLPIPYNAIWLEDDCLNATVKKVNDADIADYKPTNVARIAPNINAEDATKPFASRHSIETANGYKYNVKYTSANSIQTSIMAKGAAFFGLKSKYMSTQDFYTNLDLPDHMAIVVDAASVGLFEILRNGPLAEEKTMYYMFGPEVVNDPATKTPPEDMEFSNIRPAQKNNLNLVSCIGKSTSMIYDYSFFPIPMENLPTLSRTNYLSQFFSNFHFKLSDIKTDVKGKTYSYKTDLTIEGRLANGNIWTNSLPDSKSKNDIRYIASKLNNIAKTSQQDQFMLSSSYQQKRSGDWLQVLLCAALKDRSRNFHKFNKDGSAGPSIARDISKIYFVTHDRVALCFALLNGVNCLFTHYDPRDGHSITCFDLMDEEEEARRTAEKTAWIQNDGWTPYKTSMNELVLALKSYQEATYKPLITDKVAFEIGEIQKLNTFVQEPAQINYITQFIFRNMLIMIELKRLMPDLRSHIEELEATIAATDAAIATGQNIIELFDAARSTFERLDKLHKSTLEKLAESTTDITVITSKLKKSQLYKSADSWMWDISFFEWTDKKKKIQYTNRILEQLDTNPNIFFGTDRNIFLYQLHDLPIELKRTISKVYFDIYTKLMGMDVPIDWVSKKFGSLTFNKYRSVVASFCIEVLFCLGYDKPAEQTFPGIDEILVAQNKGDRELRSKTEEEELLSSRLIIGENEDFNNRLDSKTFSAGMSGAISTGDVVEIPLINEVAITDEATIVAVDEANTAQVKNGNLFTLAAAAAELQPYEYSTKEATYPLFGYLIFYANQGEELLELLKAINDDTGYQPMDDIVRENKRERSLSQTGGDPIITAFRNLIDPINPRGNGKGDLCFHPLLPLYIVLQGFIDSICNEAIYESMDYEIYLQYFQYMKMIHHTLIKIYNNDAKVYKLAAYAIGMGLKELLLTAYRTPEGYDKCLTATGMTNPIFLRMTNMFATSVIGVPILSADEIRAGHRFLDSTLFYTFMRQVKDSSNMEGINTPSYATFVTDVKSFSKKMSESMNGIKVRKLTKKMPKSITYFLAQISRRDVSKRTTQKISSRPLLTTSWKGRHSRFSSEAMTRKKQPTRVMADYIRRSAFLKQVPI